jgi:hypothetical protein
MDKQKELEMFARTLDTMQAQGIDLLCIIGISTEGKGMLIPSKISMQTFGDDTSFVIEDILLQMGTRGHSGQHTKPVENKRSFIIKDN